MHPDPFRDAASGRKAIAEALAAIDKMETGMKYERLTYETVAGQTALEVVTAAHELATHNRVHVLFDFNGEHFTADPFETLADAKSRFAAETGVEVLTHEELGERAREYLARTQGADE